jgi:hypothetical protein
VDSVEVRFQYTEREYVKAEREYLFAGRVLSKFIIVFIPLFFVFSLYSLVASRMSPYVGIFSLAVSVVGILFELALYFYVPRRNFKITSKLREKYFLKFSTDGIVFKTQTIDSSLKWDIYSALWESDDFYYLVQQSGNFTLIPKRAFEGSNVDSFKKIALEAVKNFKRI